MKKKRSKRIENVFDVFWDELDSGERCLVLVDTKGRKKKYKVKK